jgi:hypothetical protein
MGIAILHAYTLYDQMIIYIYPQAYPLVYCPT